MSEPDWIEAPEVWNTVRLGDWTLPGICVVKMGREWEIDFRKGDKRDGGTSTNKGADPAKLSIRVTMSARQWREEWLPILPYIEPAQGKPKGPFGIAHPEPNSRKIETIEITSIDGGAPTAKSGVTYDIKCQQWFPRPKETKKTEGPKYTDWPKLFTNEGTGNVFNEPKLRPSGLEALEIAFSGPPRQGVNTIHDPANGILRLDDDE